MNHVHSLTLALVASALALALPASAVPTTMTYAGVLTDDGVRVEGPVDVTFRLFDDETAGSEQYSEVQQGVLVLDGELVTELGANALDDATLELPELWLEVTVNATPLEPRVRLNSVPYALRAEAAARAEEALTLGGLLATDVVTQSQLAALGLNGGLVAGTGINIASGTISIATAGVTSVHLAANAVTTTAIADSAVTLAKLASDSVDAARIIDGAITLAKLASNSVNGTTIVDGSIGISDLAGNIVDTTKIVDGSVGLGDLAGNSVDGTKIVNGSLLAADLGADSVTSAAIGNGQVGPTEIAADAVTSAAIGASQVGTLEVADSAITAAKIANGTLTAAKVSGAVPIFQVTADGCVDEVGSISTSSLCSKSTVGCAVNQCRGCVDNVCTSVCQAPNNFCANLRLGSIFP